MGSSKIGTRSQQNGQAVHLISCLDGSIGNQLQQWCREVVEGSLDQCWDGSNEIWGQWKMMGCIEGGKRKKLGLVVTGCFGLE